MTQQVYGAASPVRALAYGSALVAEAREHPEIVCLGADLTGSTDTGLFRELFPDRFFNLGIAEANLVGIAAGMARGGDVPFVHSFGVFLTRRAYDQVAMQVAYPRTNVKLVGFLPGLTTVLGVTHQSIDDLALMRALPNMVVVEPVDAEQVGQAVRAAVNWDGPVYLRVQMDVQPLLGIGAPRFEMGTGQLLREGTDGVIFACGSMVRLALTAAERLAAQGRQVAVANIHTLKPLDTPFVVDLARRTGAVVTAENHSIIGGLGSAVAEALAEAAVPARLHRIGVRDTFAEGGSKPYLFQKYGLTVEAILAAFERSWRNT